MSEQDLIEYGKRYAFCETRAVDAISEWTDEGGSFRSWTMGAFGWPVPSTEGVDGVKYFRYSREAVDNAMQEQGWEG